MSFIPVFNFVLYITLFCVIWDVTSLDAEHSMGNLSSLGMWLLKKVTLNSDEKIMFKGEFITFLLIPKSHVARDMEAGYKTWK